MGQSQAVQVEVVSLLTLRTRCRAQRAGRNAQRGQQPLLHLRAQLRLQRNQIVHRRCRAPLPQQPVAAYVNRFQRDGQLFSLPHEVPGQQPAHVQFLPNLVRIQTPAPHTSA